MIFMVSDFVFCYCCCCLSLIRISSSVLISFSFLKTNFSYLLVETPTLIEGCDNLEIQMSSTENFTVPVPRFLSPINETLNVSCLPVVVKTVGLHQILCQGHDETFNASCKFNVSVLLKDELTTEANTIPPKGNRLFLF